MNRWGRGGKGEENGGELNHLLSSPFSSFTHNAQINFPFSLSLLSSLTHSQLHFIVAHTHFSILLSPSLKYRMVWDMLTSSFVSCPTSYLFTHFLLLLHIRWNQQDTQTLVITPNEPVTNLSSFHLGYILNIHIFVHLTASLQHMKVLITDGQKHQLSKELFCLKKEVNGPN